MAKALKSATQLVSIAALVAATQSETKYMFASHAAVEPLVADGMAEVNTEIVNPANETEFAVRATEKAIASMNTAPATPAPTPAAPAKMTFTIEIIDAPAKRKRGNSGASLYPFDALPAPDANGKVSAFFIPATATKPEPWKSLQSAVSAATRRFATVTGTKERLNAKGEKITRSIYDYTRKFSVSEGVKGDVKGAWVSRTQ